MRSAWQAVALLLPNVAAEYVHPSGWVKRASEVFSSKPEYTWAPGVSDRVPGSPLDPGYESTTPQAAPTESVYTAEMDEIVYVTEVTTISTTICPSSTPFMVSQDKTSISSHFSTSSCTTISDKTVTGTLSQGPDGQVRTPEPSDSGTQTKHYSITSVPLTGTISVSGNRPEGSSGASSVTASSEGSATESSAIVFLSSIVSSASNSWTAASTVALPLSSNTQVGNSNWGTLNTGCFPKWLPQADGTPYTSAPWGNATTKNADGTVPGDVPNTGVTRYYNLTITRSMLAVDGVLRNVMLINDQFPAPAIQANWGDMLHITVHNQLSYPYEGTSLHWHGMLQKSTPWYDGVPAIGQCPIAPGETFTYVFQAELYGTSWYHSHFSAQYIAGLAGPMTIYGPTQLDYDCDIGPIMLSDWYHIPYFTAVEAVTGTDLSLIPPMSDNNLIQGRNNFTCSDTSYDNGTYNLASKINSSLTTYQCQENATLSQFRFQAGKTHRLRLINHGSDGVQKFRIDGIDKMTVIAVDYVPVVPYETDIATISIAQRIDVLVTAPNDTSASYWMRAEDTGGTSCGGNSHPLALAAIYNEDADTSILPTTSAASVINASVCDISVPYTTPEYKITPSTPTYQQDLAITLDLNGTGSYEWRMNNQTFRGNYNHPILFMAAEGNVSYPYDPQWNVYNFENNRSVVFNLTNETPTAHPFHMHGHNFYVLDDGSGVWNGTVRNPSNPSRRDTQVLPSSGYLAIQMEQDNPGVWPMHCHIPLHVSSGLALNIMSRPDDIVNAPGVMDQTCVAWDSYSNKIVVDQIDSGT